MANWKTGLQEVLESFPGVSRYEIHRTRSSESDADNNIQIQIRLTQDSIGIAERLLVLFAAKRTNPHAGAVSSNLSNPTLSLTCNTKQADGLARALRYASEIDMAEEPSMQGEKHGSIALPILLSRCLAAFADKYQSHSGIIDLPSLPVWSNVLRVLQRDPIPQIELNRRAVISTRTRKVVLRECEALGWVESRRVSKPRITVLVNLTDDGIKVRNSAERRIQAVEDRWNKLNTKHHIRLRSALEQIVEGFELEYPYYITGYGPADDGLTGGAYVPAEEGPPRIPARGEEWPVVIRNPQSKSSNMPMSALLSQALAGFAIEYEMENWGRLGHILSLFRYIGSEGVPLKSVRSAGSITGNGRSLHERHMNIVLEPGKPSDNSRTVYLSPKARRARDSYAFLVFELESRWRRRYGEDIMNDLRESLQSLSKGWRTNYPDYPNTTSWMMPWFSPYKV